MGLGLEDLDLPILAFPVPKNPKPFNPNVIDRIFSKLTAGMEVARKHLLQISSKDTVSLVINLDHLWFDIDQNTKRGTQESVLPALEWALNRDMTWSGPKTGPDTGIDWTPEITFDLADAAWLQAYTHFLSGFCELVLAVSTEDPIREVVIASAQP